MSYCHSEDGTGGLSRARRHPGSELGMHSEPTTRLEGVRRGTTTSTSTRVGTNSSVSALKGSSVTIGIDAAVVANRHVVVRHPQAGRKGEVVDEFADAPSLAGMDALTKQSA